MLRSLKKKLTELEIDYEAKLKIYNEYSEDKKLLKLKKDFNVKREIIVEKQNQITNIIKKIDKEERLEEHIERSKEWEKAKEKFDNFKPYKDFLKKIGGLLKENHGEIPYDILMYEMIQDGYTEKQFHRIFKLILDDWDMRKIIRYSRYRTGIWTLHNKKLLELNGS